ncbi:MAG: hypothetical protein DI551_11970 [Micavibrio aeruginosavorus]|uniref:Uncharacterized protein n=1 Tax=Micavibrio aeruginosavorus TaxID=349221 RepID=A0A2W5MQR0_9BACT|nr:MAG: hypothetical protein DI551_11970 [Micavibrio aeruginosavorus]
MDKEFKIQQLLVEACRETDYVLPDFEPMTILKVCGHPDSIDQDNVYHSFQTLLDDRAPYAAPYLVWEEESDCHHNADGIEADGHRLVAYFTETVNLNEIKPLIELSLRQEFKRQGLKMEDHPVIITHATGDYYSRNTLGRPLHPK